MQDTFCGLFLHSKGDPLTSLGLNGKSSFCFRGACSPLDVFLRMGAQSESLGSVWIGGGVLTRIQEAKYD